MKKLGIVLCLLCVGCVYLTELGESGDPNAVVVPVLDPNTTGAVVEIGEAIGAVGALTGNPALVGVGVLLVAITSILGAGYLRKK